MLKRVCAVCKDSNVTAYAGKDNIPLCSKCWHDLYEDKISLEYVEECFNKGLENEQEGILV